MIGHRGVLLVGALLLVTFAAGLLRGAEPAAPAAEEPMETVASAAATVEMAEISLRQGRHVEGRVVYEDAERIDLERPDGSVTGYRKEQIAPEIRRFSISRVVWIERSGDLSQDKAQDAPEPSGELMKALDAFERALVLATTPADRGRLEAKIGTVQRMQDAWHTEMVRRQELEIMVQEAELLKLERQLTSQRLAALKQQEEELRRLRTDVNLLRNDSRRLATVVEGVAEAVADIEEELDDLSYFDRFYVRTNVFIDLQREHNDLRREVGRLRDRVRDR
jgi:hypothetical protein